MSIQILTQSANIPLPTQSQVALPLSEPACAVSSLAVSIAGREGCKTGIWECAPGRFRRNVAQGEVMHFLAGSGTFQRDGEDTVYSFGAGDTVFFPPDTHGVWEIHHTLRKVYVLV